MKRVLLAAIGLASSWLAQFAQAVEISAGTAEYVTVRDCIVAGVSGCDEVSPVLFGNYGGFPGEAASSASISVSGYGSTNGSVSLSGVVGAPVLKASATSALGKRLSTNSVALQRYVYDGIAPTSRSFGGTLTYSQFVPSTAHADSITTAAIRVFSLLTSTVSVGPTQAENFQTLFDYFSTLPGFVELATTSYTDSASTLAGTATLSATVRLNPGDAVWVWTLLQTPAANGGWVDASHTFVTAWDDPAGLTPAVVAVPEPGALALWLGGALVVAGRCRGARRQGSLTPLPSVLSRRVAAPACRSFPR